MLTRRVACILDINPAFKFIFYAAEVRAGASHARVHPLDHKGKDPRLIPRLVHQAVPEALLLGQNVESLVHTPAHGVELLGAFGVAHGIEGGVDHQEGRHHFRGILRSRVDSFDELVGDSGPDFTLVKGGVSETEGGRRRGATRSLLLGSPWVSLGGEVPLGVT